MITDLMKIPKGIVNKTDIIFMRNAYKTLLDKNVVTKTDLKTAVSRKYRGDFYGLLDSLGVPPIIWPTILELNNMKSTNDFTGSETSIKMISTIDAESLLPR